MSALRYVGIYCDYPDCHSGEDFADSRASAGRDVLRRRGWQVATPGGQDFCQDHHTHRTRKEKR